MEENFIVLRDMSSAVTTEPFGAESAARGVEAVPSEPRIDVLELGKHEVRDLARDPEVKAVTRLMPTHLIAPVSDEDAEVQAGGKPTEATGPTWGVSAVGADLSPRTGAGVVVSVLDTGIDSTHPAFQGVSLLEEDFSGSGNGDRQGHGTHCAGTIFGREVDGTRIGVATGVSQALIGKVLGDDGGGDSDMLFRGIQWAVDEGAHVISMSLGFDFPGMVQRLQQRGWPVDLATSVALEAYRGNLRMFDALMQLIQRRAAFTAGTVVVAASGNESKRQVNPDYELAASLPAAAEGVISTGALAESANGLTVAPFSNTFVQVAAPGVAVVSAKAGGGLRSLNGTSMATPHAAGVAALWWEDVMASPLPATAGTVTAHLLARSDITALAPDVDVADRGVGLVRAP
jgi:subtilisin family serine protease